MLGSVEPNHPNRFVVGLSVWCIDILPRPKGRGFLLDGDVFMLGMNTMARGPYATLWHGLRAAKSRENVDRGVDVAVMMGSAI